MQVENPCETQSSPAPTNIANEIVPDKHSALIAEAFVANTVSTLSIITNIEKLSPLNKIFEIPKFDISKFTIAEGNYHIINSKTKPIEKLDPTETVPVSPPKSVSFDIDTETKWNLPSPTWVQQQQHRFPM